jgi:hypothetical protein
METQLNNVQLKDVKIDYNTMQSSPNFRLKRILVWRWRQGIIQQEDVNWANNYSLSNTSSIRIDT